MESMMGRNGDWRQRVFCVLKMNEWMKEKELFIRNACLCSVWCHPLSNSIANTQVSSKPTRNKSHRKITLFLTALQALCSSFAFFLELILVQNNNNNCTIFSVFYGWGIVLSTPQSSSHLICTGHRRCQYSHFTDGNNV